MRKKNVPSRTGWTRETCKSFSRRKTKVADLLRPPCTSGCVYRVNKGDLQLISKVGKEKLRISWGHPILGVTESAKLKLG